MLDLKTIRANPEHIRQVCQDKKITIDLDAFFVMDETLRGLQWQISDINNQRTIAASTQDRELGKSLKETSEKLTAQYDSLYPSFLEIYKQVPNLYSDDTPLGHDDTDNPVIKTRWTPRVFDFTPVEHYVLGEQLGMLNFEAASQVSGARFSYIQGDLVKLQFALVQFVMDTLTDQTILQDIITRRWLTVSSKPFIPILPPVIMKREVMDQMGRYNPNDQTYELKLDDQVLVASAEHSIWPMYLGQTLSSWDLPIRYIGYSSAFRREAGSYGKDSKGILRQHQFDKLEMETFALPETSLAEHQLLIAIQEYIMQSLGIPYQLVLCCTGDMGGPDFRHVDLESWMPGQGVYRETHSADLMTDYQSRRLGTRYKLPDGTKGFVHMNDATAAALGRTMIAIMENYQQSDGTIAVPTILQKRIGKSVMK